MMWTPAILLLLAGAAFASPQSAWKDGKEYTYKVRSRTLASFNQQSKQFTGILIEAKLKVQPNGPSTLRAKIEQPRYSQIHTRLENGWESEIPPSQMNLQNLPLVDKPFEIKMNNGVVEDLIVDKNVPTWEVNVIKSIVSQFQVDVQGENAESSKHNQLPEGEQPFALFKTMEDSISGKCEVLYDISPLPEQVRANKPELVPMPELREDGDLIMVVKTKNYSNCDQRVSYHYGVSGKNGWEPGSNSNGKYLSRSSVSRVILTGSVKKHTIQSSVTINKVAHNADRKENEQGMVASKMNVTLHEVKDATEQLRAPSNPQSTGNLVYNYNNPFESESSRRPNKSNKSKKSERDSSEERDSKKSEKRNNKYSSLIYNRESSEESSLESSEQYDNDENSYLQPRPKMSEPPRNPLLPFFVGNRGNAISKDNKIDPVKVAKEIAQQIGSEMHKPDSMPDEETLEKFTILSKLIRMMNAEQIAEVQRELYEERQSSNQLKQGGNGKQTRRNTWVAFRDAVAQAGTGPALINVKQWIQNKQIQGNEAAHVIDAVSRSARTPTPEYVKTVFEITMEMPEIKEDLAARDSAILAFADLVRRAVVDQRSAHNRYPVHAFGRLFPKSNDDVEEKYIPRMAEELKEAVNKGDSKKIQVLATAIGRTGHPQMLSVFEPYLEGRKPVSTHQRLVMVLSLNKLAETHPKLARSVLYKIYANNGERYEIRTAAVYQLMLTNPPASMLQRMAEFTNYDSNKQVNSAVKSTIESIAQLENTEDRNDLVNAARSAQPLLTADNNRLQNSRSGAAKLKNPLTESAISAFGNYIGSEDSLLPKAVYANMRPSYKGMKLSEVELGGAVSSIQDLVNLVEQKVYNKHNKESNKGEDKKFSPENVAKLLGIHGQDPEQVEGFIFASGKLENSFLAFDNHSLEKIPEQLKHLAEEMKQGKSFEDTKIHNDEVTISFPTETGFPFLFTLKTPSLISVNGESKLTTEADPENKSPVPKSATFSGKVDVVIGLEVQKRLGFIAPFEHQEYTVGIDRKLQVHLPLRSEVQYDKNSKEVRVKVQPDEDKKEFKVLQYKTQPFTTKRDILNMEPTLKDKNTQIIHKDRTTSSQMDLNDESNKQRLQFKWERQTRHSEKESESKENKRRNNVDALKSLAKSVAYFVQPNNAEAEYEKYSVKLTPSSDMSAEIKVSYDSMRSGSTNNGEDSENESPKAKVPTLEKALDQQARKQKLLKEASKNINSAKANAIDITIKINGEQAKATLTAALAKSNVDKKSRALLFASAKSLNGEEYHASAALEGKTPNTESMDFEETLKANTPREYDAELHYGKGEGENHQDGNNKVKITARLRQTEERKNQIRETREAQECVKQENKNGNKMTKHCKIVNQRAMMINAGEIDVTFENEKELKEMALKAIESVESMSYHLADAEKNRDEKSEHNKLKITFEISPNDEQLDVTAKSPEGKLRLNNIKLYDNKLNSNNGNIKDSRNKENPDLTMSVDNVCSLDKTQVRTFDSRRYSLQLGQCWHVAMTTFPKNDADKPTQQQEIPDNMQVSIMTKENENEQKELKITLGEKEVELKPTGPKEIRAKINGKEIELSKHKSHQEKKNDKVVLEIFELPDKSVKLTSDKYDVEIIFDGQRSQIKAGERYRRSVRGLCGNNDGEPENDQLTPQGNLLQKPEEFTATYALTNEEKCQGPARENIKKAKEAKRVFESVRLGNVISDLEAGRESEHSKKHGSKDQGKQIKYRTMVTKTDDKICFSIKTVPMCSPKSKPTETKTQKVQFHCVDRNSASEKVAERIERGANPDLSQKQVSRTIEHQVPISCSA